ncbi:hypothetical protein [Brevundimonas lenta]|uniref:Uncharacterized protein n=1 Tax=Brevundimonas lenta TaxID=424796 RepID=A0A7W6JEI0_9CAUL|nr:hypothetical protein [Brevundimonas lenta]MBB4082678.1 hypothetical protein [Brevundimonas lenta]
MLPALLSALVLTGAPQTPPPASAPAAARQDPVQLEEVVVEARRLEEATRQFVEQIGSPPPGTRPGRWNGPICMSVTGMRADVAQFMIDRVAIAALDAGVDVEGPGCRPNVIILATSDGPGLANEMVERVGLGFRPAVSSTNLGRDALNHFRTADVPVRWWHVTVPVEPQSGQVAIAFRGQEAPTLTVRDASRLRSNVRYDIGWAIIIVDFSMTEGEPLGAVADYVAMATLTQLDPFADMRGLDTILNLFERGSDVTSLTSWDKDYLTALYSSRADRATEAQQINDMVTRMNQVRREEPETPADD